MEWGRIFGSRGGPPPRYERIFVLAPSGYTSGGPEALHQLVDCLRRLGHNAFISYVPDTLAPVPAAYSEYKIVVGAPHDEYGNLIVLPEIWAGRIREFKRASVAVWWLSLDLFFGAGQRSADDAIYHQSVADHERRVASGEPTPVPSWEELRRVRNFSQSNYATRYLWQRGLRPEPLSDYIHGEFVGEGNERRPDIVSYFPAKGGLPAVEGLMDRLPDVLWLPITGMSRSEVAHALRQSKVYVDFGTHPGKDRLVREAVLSGACVIVGGRGSAGNHRDVPVPFGFRIRESRQDFATAFVSRLRTILADFPRAQRRFAAFRRILAREEEVFEAEVRRAFPRAADALMLPTGPLVEQPGADNRP